jgi:peptide deformylase
MQKIWTINNPSEKRFLKRAPKEFNFSDHGQKEISDLVRRMDIAMQKANGVGLSANQIGLDIKIFVARWDNKFYAIFNPRIEKTSKEKGALEEGCLSIPGYHGEVERASKITLVGQNRWGKIIRIRAWGMLARIFQHETDHLNGKLFVERMKKGARLKPTE